MRLIKDRTNCVGAVVFFMLGTSLVLAPFAQGQDSGKAVPADRVVLKFRQGVDHERAYQLIDRLEITKVLPPSDELPREPSRVSGFYYELQSADGSVLYRRIIADPVPLVFDGPSPKKAFEAEPVDAKTGMPDRKVSTPQERVFVLLIPRASPGDQLVLFSSRFRPINSAGYRNGRFTTKDPPVLRPEVAPAEEVARISVVPAGS